MGIHSLTPWAGSSIYSQPGHIWDSVTGNLADFTSVFYFSVNRSGSILHGDGFAFFMAPLDSAIPNNSTGGLLGLYNPEPAMEDNSNNSSSSKLPEFVAVEFDSFANEWDPNPFTEFPHVGINVNSVTSATTVGWPSNYFEPDGAIVKGCVRYDSAEKELLVMVSYPGGNNVNADCISHGIDLRSVLPERVVIGFSGSTGDLVEASGILFWSFKSSFSNTRL
ncbi:agglutinin-2-like [Neltuma alba]|uniref:agglutinin-2-like n=1 Tax=Neltuma alba TaxID=207710 RepID=UPI0010A53235|nr:agglutinin-2-like [Prosopis alba]